MITRVKISVATCWVFFVVSPLSRKLPSALAGFADSIFESWAKGFWLVKLVGEGRPWKIDSPAKGPTVSSSFFVM